MKKLFKFTILLNALILSIFAICPDYPTIPTTPTTSPILITSASPGMSNFPPSTKQLSVSFFITPESLSCPSNSKFYLFSMNVGTTPDYLTVYVDCNTLNVNVENSLFTKNILLSTPFFSSTLGPLGIYFTFDMNAAILGIHIKSDIFVTSGPMNVVLTSNHSFDTNSKFYFCADKNGVSFQACTVSNLVFEYRFYSPYTSLYGHLSGPDPAIAAFYPLTDGSLATSIGSASSAYFGDKISNPTIGTSPTWDSSNNFVTLTSGQFLTIPLPDISSTIPTLSYSFSFAAWVRITSFSTSPFTTLFAMYSADGTQVGYKLTANQGGFFKLAFGYYDLSLPISAYSILNQWQLVGFTVSSVTNMQYLEGYLFVGTLSYQLSTSDGTTRDLSTASVIRIGGSVNAFSGDVSTIKIITQGGGFVRTTDLCSSDNSIEFGVGSFALACSSTNSLNVADNECYVTCPSGARSTSGETPVSFCISCPKNYCNTCDDINCLSCLADYFLYQGDCLDSCPSKTYSTSTACIDCSDNCLECDSLECSNCEINYSLYQGECLSSCPEKMYSDGSICQNCPTDCKTCNNQDCFTCTTDSFLYQGNCLDSCPAKTYSTGAACHDCSANCAECNQTECLVCDQNYFLYQEICFDSCPDKTYSTSTACYDCSANCSECDNENCLACDEKFFLYQGGCLDSCPEKTYSTSTACYDCSANCSECDNENCLACEENFFLYQGGCLDSCPDKTYSTSAACYDCLDNCTECENTKCLVCDENFLLYQGDCIDSCPDKTYSTGSVCESCSPANCRICNNLDCLTCDENYFFYQGNCLGSCPDRTYSTSTACHDCLTNCEICSILECLVCEINGFLYQGSCLGSCPEKTYSTSTSCHDCSANCALCENLKCLACDVNYLLSEGACVDSCPAKSYSDLTSCIACSENCTDCDADGCKICEKDYELNKEKKCALPTPPPSPKKSGLSSGAISGIICGIVIIILIAILGKVYFNDKRASKNKYKNPESSSDDINPKPVSPINSEANPLMP